MKPTLGPTIPLLLLTALLACREARREEPPPPSTGVALPALEPKPAPSAAAAPAAPGDDLARLFDGSADEGVKFLRVVSLRSEGIWVKAPIGWKGFEEYYDGLLQLSSKDGQAVVMLNTGFGRTLSDAQLNLWTKSIGTRDASWEAPVDGALGKGHLAGRVGHGRGKLGGSHAELGHLFLPLPGSSSGLLVIGAVKSSAGAERRRELLACIRSIYRV